MSEQWKQWIGQVIDNQFLLSELVASSEHGAIFLTQAETASPGKAAIKIIPAQAELADRQLEQWARTAQLAHTNLLRLFDGGCCQLGEAEFLYLVMEWAEENLSQVLSQRPLFPEEAQDTFLPLLNALVYLHGNGMVHTHIKPSNIMAAGDQLKLSSDGIVPVGERFSTNRERDSFDAPELTAPNSLPTTASDIWSLGVTIVSALTQSVPVLPADGLGDPHVPETLPQPFLDIARNALRSEPARRWTAAEIVQRWNSPAAVEVKAPIAAPVEPLAPTSPVSVPLSPEPAVPLSKLPAVHEARSPYPRRLPPRAPKEGTVLLPNYVIPVILGAALLLGAIFTLPRLFRHVPAEIATTTASASQARTPAVPVSEEKPTSPKITPEAHEKVKSAPESVAVGGAGKSASSIQPTQAVLTSEKVPASKVRNDGGDSSGKGEVLDQSLPEVSEKALSTIHGKVRVVVSAQVDAAGNVVSTQLESPGPSKYFAELAEKAAHRWLFNSPIADGLSVPSEWLIRFDYFPSGVKVSAEQKKP